MDEATNPNKIFEEIKRNRKDGLEFWSAREIAPNFGYIHWIKFETALRKAKKACEDEGLKTSEHFIPVANYVTISAIPEKEIVDYYLTYYACCLIAKHGDARKAGIIKARKYFSIDLPRKKISALITARIKKLEIKEKAEEIRRMQEQEAKTPSFFRAAAYAGLYRGPGFANETEIKPVPDKEGIPKLGISKLAEKQLRITQQRAENILKKEITLPNPAVTKLNQEVSSLLKRLGGVRPESRVTQAHLEKIQKRVAFSRSKVLIDD